MNIEVFRTLVFGALMMVFLGFLLLLFGPVLIGSSVSEQAAMNAIDKHSALLANIFGSLGTLAIWLIILSMIGGFVWGTHRFITRQDSRQQVTPTTTQPTLLPYQPPQRPLSLEDLRNRHTSVLK